MTESEKSSPMNNQTSTNCSTSSSDSGVVIIDNLTTIRGNNATTNTTTTTSATDKAKHQQQPYQQQYQTTNTAPECRNAKDSSDKPNATKINIHNFINISKTANGNAEQHNGPRAPSTPRSSSKRSSKNASPTVSIRSTSISIVSIDENAIDSSVVDSDSDFEDDTEGVHNNYIVKKLGQQTTYEPNSPDIPNINKGLTVLSQQISPNGSTPGVIPLANNLLKEGVVGLSPTQGALAPNAPQIGSIALSNSTDVTFGDKHFYEGPVTIQQFLIDSRDKWKPGESQDGQDNPMFNHYDEGKQESDEFDPSRKPNSPPTHLHHPYQFILNRKAVNITGVIILLTLLTGILILATGNTFKSTIEKSKILGDGDDSRKNIPINSDIDPGNGTEGGVDEVFNGTLRLISRDEWAARPPKDEMTKLKLPVHRIVISHTASDTCEKRVIQAFHMDSMGWDDIGYNFLVAADGFVYVGRGWDYQGAHTKGYNTDSIGISFVGTFTTVQPTKNQVTAAKLLIEEGVRLAKVVPDYKLYGARQLGATQSPGDAVYNIIKTWSHWSSEIST